MKERAVEAPMSVGKGFFGWVCFGAGGLGVARAFLARAFSVVNIHLTWARVTLRCRSRPPLISASQT